MKWIVHNAVNRDVERQQLNKILSDISATIDAVDKRVQNNTNVQDAVGAMVSNNIETGISVDYDRARKVLNFVLSSYVLTLTGDVSGSASIDGSGNVTLDVELNEDLVGVEEAPIDTTAYWRKDATWEQVDPSLEALALLTGTGFPARAIDDFEPVWNMREFEGPMSVVVTNGTGEAGNPSFALVNDEVSPGNMETYSTNNLGVKGWYKPALFESTGLLDGGVLSINGSNPATFDISQAIVGYTDYTTNAAAPTRNVAVYGPSTGNPVTNIAATATYVGINTPGLTVVQQTSPFSATQRRTIVALGAVVSNGTQLIAVNNLPLVMRAGINQIQDLMEAIGPINKSGNVVSPNGVNLQINKSAGVLFKQGANFDSNEEDPHNKALAALTAANFNYRLSNGTQFATTNSIDTVNYESPLGTLADIPTANKFTIQRVYIFTSNLIRIQYGQFLYATMAEAESSIATESFVTEQNIADNGTLIGFIIIRDSATDLSNVADAKFIPASKFGGPVGTGGTSILNTDSLPEGSTNLYFTDARAQAAVVIDSIADSDTTHAPSRNAVFDALALKEPVIAPGTTGQFRRGDNTWSNTLMTSGGAQDLNLVSYGSAPRIIAQKANGTSGVPTAATGNLMVLSGEGYDTTNFFEGAGMQFVASQTWTSAAHGTQINFRTTSNGSTSPGTRWIISHDGHILPNGTFDIGATATRVNAYYGTTMDLSSTATIGGSLSVTGGVTMLGAANNVTAANPTIQWRTETSVRRYRWQYMATDATDGNYNLDKWNGASFVNVLRLNTSATDFTIQGSTSTFTAAQFVSTIATGTAPMVVSSTTMVTNLNADLLDGQHSSYHLARANHTGTQTMSTISDLPVLDSGTFTPTLTNTTNITGSTAYGAQYMRVGSVVTVSGKVDIDPTTTATVSELRMTIPVASSFAADQNCAGVATNSQGKTARILGLISATGQARLVTSNDIDDTNRGWQYTYTYRIA